MTPSVEYVTNRASEPEIAEHLHRCDADFVPALSMKVSIEAYAKKLFDRSVRFEAWVDSKLIGLVAAYCSEQSRQRAFITNVSVLPDWAGKGIASVLMSNCIEHVRRAGFRRVALEVGVENQRAMALYRKLGFAAGDAREGIVPMELIVGRQT